MKIIITKKELSVIGFDTARDFLTELGQFVYRTDWTYVPVDGWNAARIVKVFLAKTKSSALLNKIRIESR